MKLHICTKCGDGRAANKQIYQAQTGRSGIVCRTCRQAEIDCRHYERSGEFTGRNIRLTAGRGNS